MSHLSVYSGFSGSGFQVFFRYNEVFSGEKENESIICKRMEEVGSRELHYCN